MQAASRMDARLLRHDRMIVANELRAALRSWSDRLIAIGIVSIALVAVRSSLSQRPLVIAAIAVAAVAAAAGAGTTRSIKRRLDFHSEDGILAADALTKDVRRRYALLIHALACAVVTTCAVVGRPTAAVLAPIGYLVGAGLYLLTFRVMLTGASPRRPFSLRVFRPLLQRPISGAIATVPAVLPLLLLRSIESGPMAAFVGVISAVIALMLTMLDYDAVRFMTESGYTAKRVIRVHARSVAIFFMLAVFASLVLSYTLVAVAIFGVVLAALTLMIARILAYRVHSKRAADTSVSIYAGVVGLTGFAMPPLLPVVVLAILWHLHRRSAPTTWLLS